MAAAPKRRCLISPCRNNLPCPVHGRRQFDIMRGTRQERGYDRAWYLLRNQFLGDNPFCADCKLAMATEAHHIRKVRDYPEGRLDPDNLMALCKACHSARTA